MKGAGRAPALTVLLLAAVLSACGLRTAPRPPQDTSPLPPQVAVVGHDRAGVSLSWQRPTRSQDGRQLYDLAGFVVERDSGRGFVPLTTIQVDDNQLVRPRQTFRYTDLQAPDSALAYRVRAFNADGQYGNPGPIVRLPLRQQ